VANLRKRILDIPTKYPDVSTRNMVSIRTEHWNSLLVIFTKKRMKMVVNTAKPPYVKFPNNEARKIRAILRKLNRSENDAKTTYAIIGRKAIVNPKFG
jgi:hypothetical protein